MLGAVFVVLRMRQTKRLIGATLTEERSNVALFPLARFTDESFPRRRIGMFEILARFKETNWAGAFETGDDLEVRNFACLYELGGLLVDNGVVDLGLVLDTLQDLVVHDWQVFGPHAAYIKKQYGVGFDARGRFEWLAKQAREHLEREHSSAPGAARRCCDPDAARLARAILPRASDVVGPPEVFVEGDAAEGEAERELALDGQELRLHGREADAADRDVSPDHGPAALLDRDLAEVHGSDCVGTALEFERGLGGLGVEIDGDREPRALDLDHLLTRVVSDAAGSFRGRTADRVPAILRLVHLEHASGSADLAPVLEKPDLRDDGHPAG
jgi:hypothetical protein